MQQSVYTCQSHSNRKLTMLYPPSKCIAPFSSYLLQVTLLHPQIVVCLFVLSRFITIICGKVRLIVNTLSLLKEKHCSLFFINYNYLFVYLVSQSVIVCRKSKISYYIDFNLLLHSEKLQVSSLSLICFFIFLSLLINVLMMSQILGNILPWWKWAKH